jgi:hypothetical protein
MRAEGDPFLQAFTHKRGHRIEVKYNSFGTYQRRDCLSSMEHNNCTKQATTDEVYEHGRWHQRIGGESMSTRYNEFEWNVMGENLG